MSDEPERGERDVGGAGSPGAFARTTTLSATWTRNGACREARRSASETRTTARERAGSRSRSATCGLIVKKPSAAIETAPIAPNAVRSSGIVQ